MGLNLKDIKNPVLRRTALFTYVPVALLFALTLYPLWAALKSYAEMWGSLCDLPHGIREVWAGKHLARNF